MTKVWIARRKVATKDRREAARDGGKKQVARSGGRKPRDPDEMPYTKKDRRPEGEYEILEADGLDDVREKVAGDADDYEFVETAALALLPDMRVEAGEIVVGERTLEEKKAGFRMIYPGLVELIEQMIEDQKSDDIIVETNLENKRG